MGNTCEGPYAHCAKLRDKEKLTEFKKEEAVMQGRPER